MKNIILILLFIGLSDQAFSQKMISATKLLDRMIRYHDPKGIWGTSAVQLELISKTPKREDRVSSLLIDLPQNLFRYSGKIQGKRIVKQVKNDDCSSTINESAEITPEDVKEFRLDCESITIYRNYYEYLYGLPMKLKDTGTKIEAKVDRQIFNGKTYLVLTVQYDPAIGEHTWLFFINPQNYAMEGYQFYKDKETKEGEYILLEGIEEVGSMKLPKTRKWYTYPDEKYLGTDILISGKILN